jgi:hypothetical protein
MKEYSIFHAARGIIFGAKSIFYDKWHLESYEKTLLNKYKCDYIDYKLLLLVILTAQTMSWCSDIHSF